jgi:hypothetical protein
MKKKRNKKRSKTTHDIEVPLYAAELLPLLVEVVERGEGDLLGLLGGLFWSLELVEERSGLRLSFQEQKGGLVVVASSLAFCSKIRKPSPAHLQRPLRGLRGGPVRPQGFVDHHGLLGRVGAAARGRRRVERVGVGRGHADVFSFLFPRLRLPLLLKSFSRSGRGFALARFEVVRRECDVRDADGVERSRKEEWKGSRFGCGEGRRESCFD